jgi:transposase
MATGAHAAILRDARKGALLRMTVVALPKDAPFASLLAIARAFRPGDPLSYSAARQVAAGRRFGETRRCLPLTPP